MAPGGTAALPLGDPQFWIATAMVAATGLLALRRVLRHLRAESATPCASCPKARLAAGAPPPARRRLPVLPAAALALALAPGAAPAELAVREVATMGTTLRVEVEAPARAAALGWTERLVRAVEATERRL
jgi:hypothetical protein